MLKLTMKRIFTTTLLGMGLMAYLGCPGPIVTDNVSDAPLHPEVIEGVHGEADQPDFDTNPSDDPEVTHRKAAEERDQFVLETRRNMEPLDSAVAALAARVKTFDEQTQSEWAATLAKLEAHREALRRMINDVARAGPDEWNSLTPAIAKARTDFERALSEAYDDLERRQVMVAEDKLAGDNKQATSDTVPATNSSNP